MPFTTRKWGPIMDSDSTRVAETAKPKTPTKRAPIFSSPERRRKRRRDEAVPIYACSPRPEKENQCRVVKRRAPWIKNRHPGRPIQPTHSTASGSRLLGPWEDSITNSIPSRDNCKSLTNFLYNEVVGRLDFDLESSGAVIEIEAKIGHVIDMETDTRLVIPITSEQVVHQDDPHQRTYFTSLIAGEQYATISEFLSSALADSQSSQSHSLRPPTKPRIPISYGHTMECDTYYELSEAAFLGLPHCIHQTLNSRTRHAQPKPKLRVTTDLRTNKILAQTVKVRLADHTIWSPMTEFDYCVSVHLVVKLEGDWHNFVEPAARRVKPSYRGTDHLSHTHLAYQIDLAEATSRKGTQEQEVAIQLSATQLRKHGILFRDREPHDFHKLVQGFSNNLRILVKGSQLADDVQRWKESR